MHILLHHTIYSKQEFESYDWEYYVIMFYMRVYGITLMGELQVMRNICSFVLSLVNCSLKNKLGLTISGELLLSLCVGEHI